MVLDCANGAAFKLGPELFRSLGVEVISIGDSPDGRNINAGCGSLHLEGLRKTRTGGEAPLLEWPLMATLTGLCLFRPTDKSSMAMG